MARGSFPPPPSAGLDRSSSALAPEAIPRAPEAGSGWRWETGAGPGGSSRRRSPGVLGAGAAAAGQRGGRRGSRVRRPERGGRDAAVRGGEARCRAGPCGGEAAHAAPRRAAPGGGDGADTANPGPAAAGAGRRAGRRGSELWKVPAGPPRGGGGGGERHRGDLRGAAALGPP